MEMFQCSIKIQDRNFVNIFLGLYFNYFFIIQSRTNKMLQVFNAVLMVDDNLQLIFIQINTIQVTDFLNRFFKFTCTLNL